MHSHSITDTIPTVNPNIALFEGATFLDRIVADARSELGLPPSPPVIPSLDSIIGAMRSRARAELADGDGDIDRDFVAGVRRWETIERAERLAGMSPAMRESMIRIMAIADDPQRSWQLDLSPAFQAYIERCEDDHNQESGGHVRYPTPQETLTNETARFSPKPDKPRPLKCLSPEWGKGSDVYSMPFKIWHGCNKCQNCIANSLNLKAWRWDVGRGPFQASIMVYGAANADEARKWTGQLAKAVNIPNRASLVTPAGEIWIVSADPLDAETIERIRAFAGANHGNCKRAPMQCTIKSENVKGRDLASFVKGNRTAQGEQRHVSFRLIGAAFAGDPVEDDFSLGDRTPIPDDEPTPTEVVLSSEVKQSRSWRKERNAKTREALRFIARAEQARLWCEGKNILTFTGPTKMLKQYADYRAGHRVYEPAWDYVVDLTGGA